MRIVRNNVVLTMKLEELLEILEDDMIDDILKTIVELDESGVEASFGIAFKNLEIDDDEDMSGVFLLNVEGNEVDFDTMIEEIATLTSLAKPLTNIRHNLTEEDIKVKNMLAWFDVKLENEFDDYI